MPSLEWGVQFTPPVAGCELVALKYNFLIEGATSTASIYVRSIVADTPASTLIPNFNATIDTMSTWSVIEIPGGLPLSADPISMSAIAMLLSDVKQHPFILAATREPSVSTAVGSTIVVGIFFLMML